MRKYPPPLPDWSSWFPIVYWLCVIHFPLHIHHLCLSGKKNCNLSLNPLHSESRSVLEGCAPTWSYYTVSTTAQEAPEASGKRSRSGPYSWATDRRLRIIRGAGAMWKPWGRREHVKARVITKLWCQGPIITSSGAWMNMKRRFMNILLSVIFLFQLSLSLLFFPLFWLSDFFPLLLIFLSLLFRFITLCVCVFSLSPWCVWGHRVLYH